MTPVTLINRRNNVYNTYQDCYTTDGSAAKATKKVFHDAFHDFI